MREIIYERDVKNKEAFIQVYLQDAAGLFGNLSTTAVKLLALIWRDCEFSKAKEINPQANMISLRKPIKEVWCQELGISMGSVNNILTSMIKEGILIERDSPIYMLDPKRFFKGNAENRVHALRVIYDYRIEEGI